MGTQLPQKKGHSPTQFLAHVYCGQTAVCIRMPLGTEVGLSLGDIVFHGDPAHPLLKRNSPQFSSDVRYGQATGWTKMPLGMEAGLSPGDFVFDGDPAPSPQIKGHSPHPIFGACLLWQKGWMDQDATWYGSKHRHRRRCVRWSCSSPLLKGVQPQFLVHVYCGQTAGWIKTPLGMEVDLRPS